MATLTIDISELPGRYAEALSRAGQGDEVVVTSTGQPAARLVPMPQPATKPRILGMHPGSMVMAPDFDDPLPDDFWLGES